MLMPVVTPSAQPIVSLTREESYPFRQFVGYSRESSALLPTCVHSRYYGSLLLYNTII
jgi:hypothetical protein